MGWLADWKRHVFLFFHDMFANKCAFWLTKLLFVTIARPELPEFPALEGSLCATLLVHKALGKLLKLAASV